MPVAIFDLFGTLASFDVVIAELKTQIPELQDHKSFFHMWWTSALRDYMALSLQGGYQAIFEIAPYALNRSLEMMGYDIEPSRQEAVIKSFKNLTIRDSALECIRLLSQNGWNLFVLTTGALNLTVDFLIRNNILDVFSNARSLPIHVLASRGPEPHVICCDDMKKAKPDPFVYTTTKQKIVTIMKMTVNPTFYMISDHAWDSSGARKCGFANVWVGEEEKTSCSAIFGRPDIRADTLLEAGQKMLAFEEQLNVLKSQTQEVTLGAKTVSSASLLGQVHMNSYASLPVFGTRSPQESLSMYASNSEPSTPQMSQSNKKAHGFRIETETTSHSAPTTPATKKTMPRSALKGASTRQVMSAPGSPSVLSPAVTVKTTHTDTKDKEFTVKELGSSIVEEDNAKQSSEAPIDNAVESK